MAKQQKAPTSGPSFWQLLPYRLFFATLGWLLPQWGAKVFLNIFCKPPKTGLKPPHVAVLAQATRFTFQTPSAVEKGRTLTLQGYAWGNPASPQKLLLLHGWRGKAADYYKLIPLLLELGFYLEAYDQPSHGASEGTYSSEQDMEFALVAYHHQRGVPYGIVAHSLGAAATFLGYYGPNREPLLPAPQKMVLLANPVRQEYAFLQAFALLGLQNRTRQAVYPLTKTIFGKTMDDVNLLLVTTPITSKILAVYVEVDEEVPLKDSVAFLAAFPDLTPLYVPTGTHSKIMRHKAVLKAVPAFLADAEPLPSKLS
jgi:hypothetical protein